MANDTYTTPNGVFQGQPDIAYPKPRDLNRRHLYP